MSFSTLPAENRPAHELTVDQLQDEIERLDNLKPAMKAYFARVREVSETLHKKAGVGHHWQSEDGCVWITEEVGGTYVEFNPKKVHRTRNTAKGEVKGDVSMTKARDLGYKVEGK